VSLSKAAAAYLRGKQDPKKMQAFITQHKCQAFRETIKDVHEESILVLRDMDISPHVVPPGHVALTAGIDMQQRSFWYVVRAWTPDLSSHLVDYGQVITWEDLEMLIYSTRYQVLGSDKTLPIWRAGLDTGGGQTIDGDWSRTEEAYMWLRRQAKKRVVFGTKGASRAQTNRVRLTVIDKMARGNRPIPGGLELRTLDVSAFKVLIHWRLTRREGESQRFRLHNDTGLDYARQILAEELRRDRRGRQRWVQVRADNHLLDCEVIAAACADNQWSPSLAMIASGGKALAIQDHEDPPEKDPSPVGPPVENIAMVAAAGIPGRAKPRWFHRR
jgi:phage terminase large subunit GpA-like protein